jgi:hydrogenase/urease accessory protein HupE
MKLRHLLSTTVCSLSSAVAFAHEGHGDHNDALDGVLHWFTQWDHLAVLAIAVAAMIWGARKLSRSRIERKQNKTTHWMN